MEYNLKFNKSPEGVSCAILTARGRTFLLASKESAILNIAKLTNEGVLNPLIKESFLTEILLREDIVEHKDPIKPLGAETKFGNMFQTNSLPLLNPTLEFCDYGQTMPHAYVVEESKLRGRSYLFPCLRFRNETKAFIRYLYSLKKIEREDKELMLIKAERLPLPESYEDMLFKKAHITS